MSEETCSLKGTGLEDGNRDCRSESPGLGVGKVMETFSGASMEIDGMVFVPKSRLDEALLLVDGLPKFEDNGEPILPASLVWHLVGTTWKKATCHRVKYLTATGVILDNNTMEEFSQHLCFSSEKAARDAKVAMHKRRNAGKVYDTKDLVR